MKPVQSKKNIYCVNKWQLVNKTIINKSTLKGQGLGVMQQSLKQASKYNTIRYDTIPKFNVN